jgi:hypothetical protein
MEKEERQERNRPAVVILRVQRPLEVEVMEEPAPQEQGNNERDEAAGERHWQRLSVPPSKAKDHLGRIGMGAAYSNYGMITSAPYFVKMATLGEISAQSLSAQGADAVLLMIGLCGFVAAFIRLRRNAPRSYRPHF